ncbi:MAG: hypothetical protein R2830_05020 [Saprospiraceae bacterium]
MRLSPSAMEPSGDQGASVEAVAKQPRKVAIVFYNDQIGSINQSVGGFSVLQPESGLSNDERITSIILILKPQY